MERPILKPVGTLVEELDTPALVADLASMERNIETMRSFLRGSNARLRPHVGPHGSPAIANKQLSAGGTVGGICVTTVGEAEAFCESGFTDILVTNKVVTPKKISRLCSLARHATIAVSVDSAGSALRISEEASASGVALDVVVDVNGREDRPGVDPGRPAVELAGAIADAEGLHFAGLMTHGEAMFREGVEAPVDEPREQIQKLLDTREMVEKSGMDVRVAAVGGTHSYHAAAMDGVTEVTAGSYVLMDERYRRMGLPFEPAARVVAAVTSLPERGRVITDGGQKAIGTDWGLPAVDGLPGASVQPLSAEHGILQIDAPSDLELGDRLWFTPWDIATCVNLHDYILAVKDGRLKAIWDLPARGRYR